MRNNILLLSILLTFLSLSSLIPTSSPCPTCPTPKPPPPPKPKPKPKPCPPPPGGHPKTPAPPAPASAKCPIDTVKLAACVDVLSGLAHAVVGEGATSACCPVVSGLSGADAALCLCTAIKAKLLDVNVFLPVALEVLVDCGKRAPEGYQCPA